MSDAVRVPLEANAEALYKSAMRQRLTRAGMLKIMRENEERDAARDAVDSDAEP